MRRPALALVFALALAGCDRGDPGLEPALPGPPLRVVATSPHEGQTDAPLDGVIRVRFDRFLDPRSPIRQSVVVTAGGLDSDGGAPAGEEFTTPSYDMLERVVVYRTSGPLVPGVRYTVRLRKPSVSDGYGFRAWDGAELESLYTFGFTTVDKPDAPSAEPAQPTAGYCDSCQNGVLVKGASGILASSCAVARCHSAEAEGGPPLGLDLSSPESIRQTAIGRPAHETLTGPRSDAQKRAPLLGVSMPILDPGEPGNSYAFFKIVADRSLFSRPGPSGPGYFPAEPVPGDIAPSEAEIARLGADFLVGHPMPYGGVMLDLAQARTLQAWVAAGAPVEGCEAVTACEMPMK